MKYKVIILTFSLILLNFIGFLDISSDNIEQIPQAYHNDYIDSPKNAFFQQPLDNITLISDDSLLWNDGLSSFPDVAVDHNGTIHFVWEDDTDGYWGSDSEIFYRNFKNYTWSDIFVISNDDSIFDDSDSHKPKIVVDSDCNLHVVWEEEIDNGVSDSDIFYRNYTAKGWSTIKMISDDETLWNDGFSTSPDLELGLNNTIHVVWEDDTDGLWGTDSEIMYCTRTDDGWTNATIISDTDTNWNNDNSKSASLLVDPLDNVHVVWEDDTDGMWGTDSEIMYCNRTNGGWSNATVISDDFSLWNTGDSKNPDIAFTNNNNVHVIWEDNTDGNWGIDSEIMYCNRTGDGWTNVTIISDDYTDWNMEDSKNPVIQGDSKGDLHVLWDDVYNGVWGNDRDIIYCNRTIDGWINGKVVSDDETNWNNMTSEHSNIFVDLAGNVNIIWQDDSEGEWGNDQEILFTRLIKHNLQITHPPDDVIDIKSSGNYLFWNITDEYLSTGIYEIEVDGINHSTGEWYQGIQVNMSLDVLKAGTFNISIVALDRFGEYVSDFVIITIKEFVLFSPQDLMYEYESIGNVIYWSVRDNVIGNTTYNLYLDNTEFENGSWNSNEQISINVDDLEIGSYNYSINLTDGIENMAEDFVIVTVIEKRVVNDPIYKIIFGFIGVIFCILLLVKNKKEKYENLE